MSEIRSVLAEALREGPRKLTREEAVEKALLYVFQLSDKDYRKMQRALSEDSFIRALEQDGYTIVASDLVSRNENPVLREAAADAERFLRVYHKHGILLNNALDVADALRSALSRSEATEKRRLWPDVACDALAHNGEHYHRVGDEMIGPFTGPHRATEKEAPRE